MASVIYRIYEHIISKDYQVSQEYRDLYKKEDKVWDKARPLLSKELIEELQNSQGDVQMQSNLDWFREGIRVGMSLMLELL